MKLPLRADYLLSGKGFEVRDADGNLLCTVPAKATRPSVEFVGFQSALELANQLLEGVFRETNWEELPDVQLEQHEN